jgi:hypothetical protein
VVGAATTSRGSRSDPSAAKTTAAAIMGIMATTVIPNKTMIILEIATTTISSA